MWKKINKVNCNWFCDWLFIIDLDIEKIELDCCFCLVLEIVLFDKRFVCDELRNCCLDFLLYNIDLVSFGLNLVLWEIGLFSIFCFM